MHRNGDPRALGILFESHKNNLIRLINNIVRDKIDTEDILHDVFLNAIKTINSDDYKDQGTIRAWLQTIAHNLSINFVLKKAKYPSVSLSTSGEYWQPLNDVSLNPEKIMIKKEAEYFLKNLVDKLPAKQKEVVVLRIYHDLKFREISESTNCSYITTRTRMHSAFNDLKKYADKIEPDSIHLD